MNRRVELAWEGAGYHGFPVTPGTIGYVSTEDQEAWSGFERVLVKAKGGDFSGVVDLLPIYDGADWMVGTACADLMGDIGSREFFDTLRPIVTSVVEPTYSVDLACTLASWGDLSAVPTVVSTLTKIHDFVDAPAIVQALSVLLEPEQGEIGDLGGLRDVAAYSRKVLQRTEAIASRLGTVDAIALLGDRFSVDRLIGALRQRLTLGAAVDPALRRRFEATTGVDCSSWYQHEVVQPQHALATLDEFERECRCGRFTPGRRYFFGHEIPD